MGARTPSLRPADRFAGPRKGGDDRSDRAARQPARARRRVRRPSRSTPPKKSAQVDRRSADRFLRSVVRFTGPTNWEEFRMAKRKKKAGKKKARKAAGKRKGGRRKAR